MKERALATVLHSAKVGSMVLVRLEVPGWRPARPGQFTMLQAEGSAYFLPRAFSVHAQRERSPDGSEVSFLIAPIGAATDELATLSPGDRVWALGPLGRGFDILGELSRPSAPGGSGRLLIVGGGVGVAPFLLVLERLREMAAASAAARDAGSPSEVTLLFGFRDAVQAEALALFEPAVDALRAEGVPTHLEGICEDGSLGRPGLVTELLEERARSGDAVLACGTHAMCEAVWDVCLRTGDGLDVWFSLEAGMACGVGSCLGCVMPMADGALARVCREGPVFSGREVFGEARHPCAAPETGGEGS